MKKIILVGAVAMLGLASCKKDRTCECTYDLAGETETIEYTIPSSTKSDAKSLCDVYSIGGTKCEIK